ncbi:RnfABCDGE type electron transport complex subunit D [candidate division KSB1 bacterium]|nr:RnfABCDGE type electron transport complex subunit D [candidate division KSB1 bacterium]
MKRLRTFFNGIYKQAKEKPVLRTLMPLIRMMDNFIFESGGVVTDAPLIRDGIGTQRFMSMVIVAIAPATIASVYFFGWRSLSVIAVSYIFGGITEIIFAIVRKESINEGLLVTGILFPLTLPPTIPLWMVAVGVVVGVALGKEVFGGTGKNIFNPALVGRVFLAIAFPVEMTTKWTAPVGGFWGGFTTYLPDAVTSATPLTIFKSTGQLTTNLDLLWGNVAGSLGETSALLLILGGLFLMLTKVSNWRIPVGYLGSAFAFGWVMWLLVPQKFAPPVFQLLSGGLLFGTFFMATDPVSAPITNLGRWIYALLLGIITIIIRGLSGYVEGVMFAILFMNIFSSLINDMTVPLIARRRERRVKASLSARLGSPKNLTK